MYVISDPTSAEVQILSSQRPRQAAVLFPALSTQVGALTMAEEAESFGAAQQNLEGILSEIDTANHSLRDIIAYCTTNYELQRPEVFQQTKTYLEDAMTNAAYQIFRGAAEITNLIDMQNYELLGMQASVQCLTTVCFQLPLSLPPLTGPRATPSCATARSLPLSSLPTLAPPSTRLQQRQRLLVRLPWSPPTQSSQHSSSFSYTTPHSALVLVAWSRPH